MVFRQCSEHGWLATPEYTVDEMGETVCPICALDDDTPAALHGYKPDGQPPNHHLKKALREPRDRFAEAFDEYHNKIGRQ